jgi:DnaJ like chaperone protein
MTNQNISVRQISLQIRQQMEHASRLQLMHYLFSLAKADEVIIQDELDMLYKIAGYLSINPHDF